MLRSPSTRGQVKSSVIVSPVSGNASGSRPAGEIGPKSTISARPPPGGVTTMKPIPPSPLFQGSRTASAKAVATTASTALPPAASTSAPTLAATPFCAATMPPREAAIGFRTTQFCVSAILKHLVVSPGSSPPVPPPQAPRVGQQVSGVVGFRGVPGGRVRHWAELLCSAHRHRRRRLVRAALRRAALEGRFATLLQLRVGNRAAFLGDALGAKRRVAA